MKIQEIKKLISKGKTDKAFDILLENSEDNNLIVQSGRLESIEKLFLSRLIDFEKYTMEKNMINTALLNFLDNKKEESEELVKAIEIKPSLDITPSKEMEVSIQISDSQEFNKNTEFKEFGFSLFIPPAKEWSEPKIYDFFEYIGKQVFASPEDQENAKLGMQVVPFGEMHAQSKHVHIQNGKEMEIEFLNDSTSELIEKYIKKYNALLMDLHQITLNEEQENEVRRRMFLGDLKTNKIPFANSIIVSVMEKKYAEHDYITPNFINLFRTETKNLHESINKMETTDNSIIWISKTKLMNIGINDVVQDIITYRAKKIIETKDHFFGVGIQWSPETDASIEIWSDLKKMFDSFRIITTPKV